MSENQKRDELRYSISHDPKMAAVINEIALAQPSPNQEEYARRHKMCLDLLTMAFETYFVEMQDMGAKVVADIHRRKEQAIVLSQQLAEARAKLAEATTAAPTLYTFKATAMDPKKEEELKALPASSSGSTPRRMDCHVADDLMLRAPAMTCAVCGTIGNALDTSYSLVKNGDRYDMVPLCQCCSRRIVQTVPDRNPPSCDCPGLPYRHRDDCPNR